VTKPVAPYIWASPRGPLHFTPLHSTATALGDPAGLSAACLSRSLWEGRLARQRRAVREPGDSSRSSEEEARVAAAARGGSLLVAGGGGGGYSGGKAGRSGQSGKGTSIPLAWISANQTLPAIHPPFPRTTQTRRRHRCVVPLPSFLHRPLPGPCWKRSSLLPVLLDSLLVLAIQLALCKYINWSGALQIGGNKANRVFFPFISSLTFFLVLVFLRLRAREAIYTDLVKGN
jgi:hypothetical protein